MPVVAAAVGVLGALFGVFLTNYLRAKSDARTESRERLTKLYGPIWLLTAHTKQLKELIRSPEQEWHLLEQIEGVMADPMHARLARGIADADAQIVQTIVTWAGLALNAEIPDSFLKFLQHAAVVQLAVETEQSPPPGTWSDYPDDLDRVVDDAVRQLQATLGLDGRRSFAALSATRQRRNGPVVRRST